MPFIMILRTRKKNSSRMLSKAVLEVPTLDPVIVPTLEPVMVPALDPVMVPALEPVIVPTRESATPVLEPVIVPAWEIVTKDSRSSPAITMFRSRVIVVSPSRRISLGRIT
jgi:hypothetical protein